MKNYKEYVAGDIKLPTGVSYKTIIDEDMVNRAVLEGLYKTYADKIYPLPVYDPKEKAYKGEAIETLYGKPLSEIADNIIKCLLEDIE